jgi:hypothetical protein
MPRHSIPQSQVDTVERIARKAYERSGHDAVVAAVIIEKERSLERAVGGVWLDQARVIVGKLLDNWAGDRRFDGDES